MFRAAAPKVVVDRMVGAEARHEDEYFETAVPELRPLSFDDYIGQAEVKENLKIYVRSARVRSTTLDHVILHGPPGLGKTTLARVLANEMNVPLVETRGPIFERNGDLAGVIANLQPGSILFIDEIHRLPIKVEEILYSAMEDYMVDSIIGQGPAARTIRLPVPRFTLVGATTRLALLSKPLLDRFGIQERLEFYDHDALGQILARSARILGVTVTSCGSAEIAKRARGTPRIANRLLKRVWDFTIGIGESTIDRIKAHQMLERQGIDISGLDRIDRLVLKTVAEQYGGGPVGIEALAATLNEDRATLEEVYEPYLVQMGFLARGPRGRLLTARGREHLEQF